MRARRLSWATMLTAVAALFGGATSASAESTQVTRGQYLVTMAGCSDCHTPGTFLGHPDLTRFLGGSDVGFAIPGVGVFPGRNITPDKETGIGSWTTAQIVTAITTGVRPDGRKLVPIMPYMAFSKLTKSDAEAIALYLKTLKPVRNAVPGPFGPNEKPTVLVYDVLPPDVYLGLPKPPAGK